jgi:hypothetical protein
VLLSLKVVNIFFKIWNETVVRSVWYVCYLSFRGSVSCFRIVLGQLSVGNLAYHHWWQIFPQWHVMFLRQHVFLLNLLALNTAVGIECNSYIEKVYVGSVNCYVLLVSVSQSYSEDNSGRVQERVALCSSFLCNISKICSKIPWVRRT